MKLFVVIFAMIVAVQALEGEQKARFEAAYKACVGKTNVDEALIMRLRKKENVDDPKLKAYVNCMFEKFGFIKDGQIQLDVLKDKLPANVDKAEAAKVVENCKDKKGDVLEEVAFNVYRCFQQTSTIKLF